MEQKDLRPHLSVGESAGLVGLLAEEVSELVVDLQPRPHGSGARGQAVCCRPNDVRVAVLVLGRAELPRAVSALDVPHITAVDEARKVEVVSDPWHKVPGFDSVAWVAVRAAENP